MISYILQLPEMKNKKRAVLMGSLQATVASLSVLSQLYKTLENCKIKKKTEMYSSPFISKLNVHVTYVNVPLKRTYTLTNLNRSNQN